MKKLLTAIALSTSALCSYAAFADCGINEFCTGTRAVYNENNIRILEIFADGNAKIQYDNGNQDTVAITALSHEPDHEGGFQKNTMAIYNENDVTILELFADGNARIQYANQNQDTVNISALRHPITWLHGFKVNDPAVYNENDVTILEIFDDGNARIQYSNQNQDTVSVDALRHPITTLMGFSTGAQAVYNENDVIIIEPYADGNVRIQYTNGNQDTVSVSALSQPVACAVVVNN